MQIVVSSPGDKPKGAEKVLFDDYVKRIDRNFKFEIDTGNSDGKLKKSDFVVVLDEKGQRFDNLTFAGKLNNVMSSGGADRVVFVIGDAYGVSDELRKRADLVWSFSDQVFPHKLFRVMLVEQIYRSLEIIKGSPYHHL